MVYDYPGAGPEPFARATPALYAGATGQAGQTENAEKVIIQLKISVSFRTWFNILLDH